MELLFGTEELLYIFTERIGLKIFSLLLILGFHDGSIFHVVRVFECLAQCDGGPS